jgi:hypothetical protein
MTAITNANTAVVFADAILTEQIGRELRFGVQTPFLFQDLVWMPPTLQNTKRFSDVIYANMTASAAHTESDEVASSANTPTAVDIDTAMYAKGAFMADWGTGLNVHQAVPATMQALMTACYLRFETDVLALATSITANQGSATTVMTIDNFVSVTAAFRAQSKRSPTKPLMVLSESARRDLQADLMAGGQSINASMIGQQLSDAVSSANQGEWAEFGGYRIASTDGMPVGDTTGKSCMLVHMSPEGAALLLVFSRDIYAEAGREPNRVGTWLVASHAHGAGIRDQARAYRFVVRA